MDIVIIYSITYIYVVRENGMIEQKRRKDKMEGCFRLHVTSTAEV